ncbi:MAG TPA: HAD family hydrolase [Kofleriaceae bacterium]|nr:HAD family hydrolase [Kofleriaceae bacterium]
MIAALFDMDNTLLRGDTGMSWTRFLYRRGELPAAMVAKVVYWSTLYKLAVLDMEAVVTRLVADLEGDSEAEMIAKCDEWYRRDIASLVAPAARVAIAHHRAAGHTIVLATGSTVYAARPVAAGVAIDHVLATELEVDPTGSFTGKPRALCFGRHKVTLAEAWAEREGIDLARSYFYSDSYNDLPMLERVGTAIAVNPDARLLRHARKKGWQTTRWA